MANTRSTNKPDDITVTWTLAWLHLLGLVIVPALGCGGIDQNDMRRYALDRPSDEELESSQPAPKAPPPNQQASAANHPAATPQTAVVSPTPADDLSPGTGSGSPAESSADPEQSDAPLSDTRPPNPDLSETQRRQTSIDNLQRIAEALEKYHKAKGTYPPQTVRSTSGQPLYSWRVALLPFLGYESLYQAFRDDEPWNSKHNQKLMAMIPSVYQSPERFDTRTNYLLPVGTTTAFTGRTTLPPRRWEDGAENTVILVEVDDNLAVEWTRPTDYTIQPRQPTSGLGKLRGDGFFVIWGGGALSMVSASIGVKDARAMFSIDGGEPFSSYSVRKPATASVAAATDTPSTSAASTRQDGDDTMTMATTRAPVTGGSDVPSPTGSALEGRLTQQAIDTFRAGYESEALDFLMLAYLTDEPSTRIEFRWIPALRRPAFVVRYGVGIQYSGPKSDRLDKFKIDKGPQNWSKHSRDIRSVSGDLAGHLLDFLEASPRFLPAVFQTESTKPLRGTAEPRGIEFLGVADHHTLQLAARRQNVDVVVLFDIEERRSRSGREIREARLRLIDPVARRELFVSPVVNSVKRNEKLGRPLYEDPVDEALRQFESMISEKLQPRMIPSGLRPRHVAKRVASFRPSSNESPLKTLCEIRFYHQSDLLKVDQALAAYQAILGEDAGLRMLAGKSQRRTDDLEPWTPSVRIAEQPRRRVSSDDDDD